MKNEISVADLDFLTPGSVFTREDGRESRFLHLTNQALPKKLQAEYPPQVVYIDENGNVLSCGINRFLNKRKFLNVDPELEARLLNLIALTSSDNEDTLDLEGDNEDGADDELTIDDGDGTSVFDAMSDALEESDGEGDTILDSVLANQKPGDFVDDLKDVAIYLPVTNAELPAFLTAKQLGAATSSYQQSPGIAPGTIQHSLFIREEDGITSKKLYASFSPKNSETNEIYDFQVNIEGREIVVNWDTFVGIFPCVFYGTRMFQVIFHSEGNYEAAPPAVEPVAVATQVVQVAAENEAEADAAAELAAIEAEVGDSPVANVARSGAPLQVQVSPQ